MKKLICFMLSLVMTLTSFSVLQVVNADSSTDEYVSTINRYIDKVNSKEYDELLKVVSPLKRHEYHELFVNPENFTNKSGMLNIAKIINITEIHQIADTSVPDVRPDDYNEYDNVRFYKVKWTLQTYSDSEYFFNGTQAAVFIIGYLNDNVYFLDLVIPPENDNLILQNNEISISPMSCDTPSSSSDAWKNPTSIKVYRTGSKTIQNVNFKTYCSVVLQNEIGNYTSWSDNAFRAVAMAIKNYGWRRIVGTKKYPNLGYDVKDSTVDQVYNPNMAVNTKSSNTINYIWNYVMLDANYHLFVGFHCASVNTNSYAAYHKGILSQTGSRDLANNGYTWTAILSYYYTRESSISYCVSDMAVGSIKVIDLNHSPRTTVAYNNYTHWNTCNICQCAHNRKTHTLVLHVSIYSCTGCAYTTKNGAGTTSLDHRLEV